MEKLKSPYGEWMTSFERWHEVLLYCNNYKTDTNEELFRPSFVIQQMKDMYGDPSPELRQYAKDQMMASFLKFWNSL